MSLLRKRVQGTQFFEDKTGRHNTAGVLLQVLFGVANRIELHMKKFKLENNITLPFIWTNLLHRLHVCDRITFSFRIVIYFLCNSIRFAISVNTNLKVCFTYFTRNFVIF